MSDDWNWGPSYMDANHDGKVSLYEYTYWEAMHPPDNTPTARMRRTAEQPLPKETVKYTPPERLTSAEFDRCRKIISNGIKDEIPMLVVCIIVVFCPWVVFAFLYEGYFGWGAFFGALLALGASAFGILCAYFEISEIRWGKKVYKNYHAVYKRSVSEWEYYLYTLYRRKQKKKAFFTWLAIGFFIALLVCILNLWFMAVTL